MGSCSTTVTGGRRWVARVAMLAGLLAVTGTLAAGLKREAGAAGAPRSSGRAALECRWFLLRPKDDFKSAERTEGHLALLKRAAAAGYNGLVLDEHNLGIMDRMPPEYFDNLRRFLAEARVGSSRVDLQACKLEYSIVSPK